MIIKKLQRLYDNIYWYTKNGYAVAFWGNLIDNKFALPILWFWNLLGYILYLSLRLLILLTVMWIITII